MDVRLYAMGCGHDHRLGVGKAEANRMTPAEVTVFSENKLMVRGVWAGGAHSMVLTDKGLYAFGYNEQGQLGVGSYGTIIKPTGVVGFDKAEAVEGVALGGYHSVVWKAGGGVYSFGGNGNGQLGVGGDVNSKNPTEIREFSDHIVKNISSGAQHTLAVTDLGVFSWGLGDNGQLGYHGDSFDEMLSKQNRIKAEIANRARVSAFNTNPSEERGLGGETAVPSEVGEYNPMLHPARKHGAKETREFFAAFCQRTPKVIPFFEGWDVASILSATAGYNASSILTTEGCYIFGARPGVVRETIPDTIPTLVQPPLPRSTIAQLLPLRDLRLTLCESNEVLSIWQTTPTEDYVKLENTSLPPGTRLHGTELSVFATTQQNISTFGDNFFGQLGYPTDTTEPEFTPPKRLELPTVGTSHPSFKPWLNKVAVGWHHTLMCVAFGELEK